MPVVAFTNFGGVFPKVDPTLLPPNSAQVAKNCRMQSGGAIEPMAGASRSYPASGSLAGGVVKSVYRFQRAVASETDYWFTSSSDTDYQPGQVAGDAYERTYFTSSAHVPRYTLSPSAQSGAGPYPANYYALGVPAPSTVATTSKSGTPDMDSEPNYRAYVYTFVTDDGQESAPSRPTAQIAQYDGETVSLSNMDAFPSGNYAAGSGKLRIYRTYSGESGADFFFAGETSGTTWTDPENPPGESLPTEGWVPPPAGMRGLTAMPNGVFAGFAGKDVHLCVPYVPYAWPDAYRVTVPLPVVALGSFGNSLAVLTVGEPYVISGGDPGLMTAQKLSVPWPCVSKRSVATVGNAVVYASTEGLVSISDSGPELLTREHFSIREWSALKPSSMLGATFDGVYIAFYDTGSVQGGIVFDPRNGAVVTTDMHATAAFADTVNGALYVVQSNVINRFDKGSALQAVWKSRKESVAKPSSFAWCQVLADAYPVVLTVWSDGVQLGPYTMAHDRPARLGVAVGRFWEVQVSGFSGRVRAVYLANSSDELASV